MKMNFKKNVVKAPIYWSRLTVLIYEMDEKEKQNPFSKCRECTYRDDLPIEHEFNRDYKQDLDEVEALYESGFPKKIAIKIVEMTYSYFDCDFCDDNVICKYHKDKMLYYGKYNLNIICKKCYEDRVEFVQQ